MPTRFLGPQSSIASRSAARCAARPIIACVPPPEFCASVVRGALRPRRHGESIDSVGVKSDSKPRRRRELHAPLAHDERFRQETAEVEDVEVGEDFHEASRGSCCYQMSVHVLKPVRRDTHTETFASATILRNSVTPPQTQASGCPIDAARRVTSSLKRHLPASSSPVAIGMAVSVARRSWLLMSSGENGSSIQYGS